MTSDMDALRVSTDATAEATDARQPAHWEVAELGGELIPHPPNSTPALTGAQSYLAHRGRWEAEWREKTYALPILSIRDQRHRKRG